MPGMKITLDLPFTTTRPRLLDDPLFSAGSLMLVDATHPLQSWAPGVPAAGSYLKNLAGEYSGPLLGTTGTGADMQFNLNNFTPGTDGLIERSSKGALHVIPSRTTATVNSGATLEYPAALKSYLLANLSHSFYFSQWRKLTRTPAGGTFPYFGGMFRTLNTSEFWHLQTSLVPNTGAQSLGNANATSGTGNLDLADRCQSFGVKAIGAFTDFAGSTSLSSWLWGVKGNVNASERANLPAYSLKRLYVEDLTVSGRSYAEVAALDADYHTAQVLTPGARYYGDTNTAP